MKLLSIAVLLVTVAMAAANSPRSYDISQAESLFEQFIKDFNRQYKDENDKKIHFEAFKESLLEINKLNAKDTHATFGINNFADYTKEEFSRMRGLRTD